MAHSGRCALRVSLLLVAILAAAACAPASGPRASNDQPAPSTPPADPARKTITIGIASAFYAFSIADRGLNVGGGGALQELWLQGLVTSGRDTPAPEARVAAEVPSLDNGSMRVESDGRVIVTWGLRPDVQWAD